MGECQYLKLLHNQKKKKEKEKKEAYIQDFIKYEILSLVLYVLLIFDKACKISHLH